MRKEWVGSHWQESFYSSPMVFAASTPLDADAGGRRPRSVLQGRRPRPRRSAPIVGRYGKPLQTGAGGTYSGKLEGRAVVGAVFEGSWAEDSGADGQCELTLSDDGWAFEGKATYGGEVYEWCGERRAPPRLYLAGEPKERWYASVLAMRSRANLMASGGGGGGQEEALRDAKEAVARCPFLPSAWEALANAAPGSSYEKRESTISPCTTLSLSLCTLTSQCHSLSLTLTPRLCAAVCDVCVQVRRYGSYCSWSQRARHTCRMNWRVGGGSKGLNCRG